MSTNRSLHRAKEATNDELYTQLTDIERKLLFIVNDTNLKEGGALEQAG